MDEVGQLAVIEYLSLKGFMPRQVYEDMVSTLGDTAPSYATVKKWAAEFMQDGDLLEEDPRSGRPATVTTEEMVDKVLDVTMADRMVATCHIANKLDTSRERLQAIIHNELQ